MKKFLVMVLALMMMVSMIGCSKTEDPKPAAAVTKDADTKDAKVTEASTDPEDNTLTVWCWDPNFNIAAMKEAEKVYKETNPNFALNIVETPWDDVQTKLTAAATSGQLETLPDIMLMQDSAFLKNLTNYPEAFADLTSTVIDFTQFAPAKVGYSSLDGKNYGVPFDSGAAIMALRTDVLEQAGLTPADFTDITWSKFLELGQVVLDKTGVPMLSGTAGSVDIITMMMLSAGQGLFKEDGTPNVIDNAPLKESMTVYAEMVKKGIFVEVNAWDEYIGTLSNGTVAGTINGCWILGSIQATPDQSGKWAMTNLPKLSIAGATNYSNNGGSSWLVTSNCKNVDLAADFFAKTYGGSTAFYDAILPSSGAIGAYLPAGGSPVYSEPNAFFGGQKIFSDITKFAGQIPNVYQGVFFYEAREAVGVAMTNVIGGADLASELKAADEAITFAISE